MIHGPKGLFSTSIYPAQPTDVKKKISESFLTFSLVGNPLFSFFKLPPSAQTWYNILLTNTQNQSLCYPNPIAFALTEDSYYIARIVQNHVLALLSAFRATQSYILLDKALEIMDVLYTTLKDKDGDGKLEWLDLGPGSGVPVPTEDSMNTPMADTLAIMWVYVLSFNRLPKYETSYQQWKNYIENTTLTDPVHTGSRILTHCWTFMLRSLWYLYKLYNEPSFLWTLEDKIAWLNPTFVLRQTTHGTSRIWDHRVKTPGYTDQGCQGLNYASYTVGNLVELYFDGCPYFDKPFMQTLLNTARDLAFRDGLTAIHDDVCGDVYLESYPTPWSMEENYSILKYATWLWQSVAAFDNSGFMDNLGVQGLSAYPSTPTIFIPAYQLVAEIYRYINS